MSNTTTTPAVAAPTTSPVPPAKTAVLPKPGEIITSTWTNNTYAMGGRIGGSHFSEVFACRDVWGNDLAAKILKPRGAHENVKANAFAEFEKLRRLRHPYVTFVFDAFEYRDTFYIITERYRCPVSTLFAIPDFDGKPWIRPISRCLLQALHYLHIHNYVHHDIHAGNVFTTLVKDEIAPIDPTKTTTQFKLADLGIAKLRGLVGTGNTRALWMLPPEVIDESRFGPIDSRVDIYHAGLLFLQLALSKELAFTRDDILAGEPRGLALTLPPPFNFALEKALRRHVQFRTADAMEFWRDLSAAP